MTTSKHSVKSKMTSVSEIKLNIAQTSSVAVKKQQSSRSGKNASYMHCGHPGSSGPNTVSRNTISIQNIGSADLCQKKPGVKIPEGHIVLTASRETSSKSTPVPKRRGYDFTSSTNSHFEGWILEVPKKFKRQCSTTTSSTKTGVSASSSLKTSLPKKTLEDKIVTSQEMYDSAHKASLKKLNFKGAEWKKPCKESFIAGAPKPYIGTCPPNFEEIAKMSKPRQKFFLTQDPRKKYCLRNPEVLRKKTYSPLKEFDMLTKMAKHADNLCADVASHSSESFICDVVDKENPLNLDFQGMDYMNTYLRDEQEMQNQRVYRRLCRYMDRRSVKAETQIMVEQELHQERLAVPKAFDIVDRNKKVITPPRVETPRIGKLYRAVDKPYNQERIEFELQRRKERYKDLYLRRKEKATKENEQREEEEKEDEEQRATTLAIKDFENVLGDINTAIEFSFNIERLPQRIEKKKRIFPHTIVETQQFKKKLKQENRIKRDEAIVKKAFYHDRLGKVKNYPEIGLEISSDTPKYVQEIELSEQSSDDADVLEVGKQGETFKLRGFHFKLGETLRGKRNEREKSKATHKVKGCQTREQWLSQLAPKKEQIRLDVEEGIIKIKSPDDPTLALFHPRYGFKVPKPNSSAIRNYIEKRLGRHYERNLRKNLKLVKPRLKYTVKKFNLISYLFGDTKKRLANLREMSQVEMDVRKLKLNTTLEYMEAKEKMMKQKNQAIKQKRLKLLGLPCRVVKKSSLQTKCENSESDSDSDWVPVKEPDLLSEEEENMKAKEEKSVKIPLRMRSNMPAPRYRETTLRRHPRHPRDYLGERVASQLFAEAVKTSGLPHLNRIKHDLLHYENIQKCQKRDYATKFEARHHHDHWNPTQKKIVDVHYQTEIVHPETTKIKQKTDDVLMENFRMANPPCNQFVNMDLTIPKWDIDAMIADHLKMSKKVIVAAKERTKDICYAHDFVFHSRPASDFDGLDFPGRQEYLQFLHEIRQTVLDTKNVDKTQDLAIDRDAFIKELEEDLHSIESCLTSMSSSECTNLTNDSGSFLLMEGKTKVPLDYIRKSLVPFEELKRSRFQVAPIDVDAEDANPFKVLPFSGQKKAQLELTLAKDSFFTFNTRLKNGLRLRLEVPVEDVRSKLIGRGANKFLGAVTTDIDENYVVELKDRPSVKMFNFKTGRDFIKDALRLKFESMLIQGQIVRTKIYDRLNEQHWEMMQKTKALYEKLFAKWEKREYEAAMSVVHKVKSYYETTDDLRRQFREMERQLLILNMDIVFIEGHWIRRIMLQNFHYLLGDQEWRYVNDWIHRVKKDKPGKKYSNGERSREEAEEDEQEEDGTEEYDESDEEEIELESFEESIAKRSIVNCRQRDKDDAWAIKAYYEDVYLKNKHPILIVFPDASSFLKGIENLKLKTFVLLLELHFTLSIHTELQSRLETFEEWCEEDLKEKSEYVSRKCQKKYFMADRAEELRRRAIDFLDEPIAESYDDEAFNKDRAVIAEVWRQVVPANVRGTNDQDVEPTVMVAMMSEVVVELIAKFEKIPTHESRRIEIALRHKRAYLQKQSRQAYIIAKRIEMEMIKVRKNLEPPYQKKKRVGKLPRYYLKKKVKKVVIEEKRISEHTKFFFRAFHDEGDVMQLADARDSLFVMDTIQEQIVPFYFDHFLKLNGYTPNYNFKTRIELRDGIESERVLVRNLIPDVMDKMEKWELARKRVMDDNIARNPKMYENVNF